MDQAKAFHMHHFGKEISEGRAGPLRAAFQRFSGHGWGVIVRLSLHRDGTYVHFRMHRNAAQRN